MQRLPARIERVGTSLRCCTRALAQSILYYSKIQLASAPTWRNAIAYSTFCYWQKMNVCLHKKSAAHSRTERDGTSLRCCRQDLAQAIFTIKVHLASSATWCHVCQLALKLFFTIVKSSWQALVAPGWKACAIACLQQRIVADIQWRQMLAHGHWRKLFFTIVKSSWQALQPGATLGSWILLW